MKVLPTSPGTVSRTWVEEMHISRDGEAYREVCQRVMEVYGPFLGRYFLKLAKQTPALWQIGGAEDVVAGFFADRLESPRCLQNWMRRDMRLRRWLANAFVWYLKEQRRRSALDRLLVPFPEGNPDAVAAQEERAAERSYAETVVLEARDRTKRILEEQGMARHWRVLWGYYYEGRKYQDLAVELRTSCNNVRTKLAKDAREVFRRVLCDLLERDGVPADDIEAEIAQLLEDLNP
jgi:hypothetical protein